MSNIASYRQCCVGVLLLLSNACLADEVRSPARNESVCEQYAQLLRLFPEERQAYGIDSFRRYTGDQPMTLGLVVAAEAIHYRHSPNDESRRRIPTGVRWLLDHRDLDNDGELGWGLPQPWDAWGDGTVNPANHPYTITTAIVANGLLDALQVDSIWSPEQQAEIRSVLVSVCRRWCTKVWSEGYGGGYFWYSPRTEDNVFGINASSMFLASLTRLLTDHGNHITDEDKALFSARRDSLVKAMISTAERRDGLPFWKYAPLPNRYHNNHPNDLLHHVYTLWGIETYRDANGSIEIPWTRSDAIKSVDRFWRRGVLSEFALGGEEKTERSARLWGAGMALAFYARWGNETQAESCFQAIRSRYGDWPQLQTNSDLEHGSQAFDRRQAAHVLYGLSLYCHGSK